MLEIDAERADLFARIIWKRIPFCSVEKSVEAPSSSIDIVSLACSMHASNSATSRKFGTGVPGARLGSGGGEGRSK